MKFAKVIVGVALAAMLSGTDAWAQTAAAPAKTETASDKANNDAMRARLEANANLPIQTYYLMNMNQPNDANEVLTAIRSMLPPDTRMYLAPMQNAIVFRGTPEQNATVQKILNDLDRPKKRYRLTYTTTDMDNGKRVGTQHFAMIVIAGQNTTLKEGSKVPVLTGSVDAGGAAAGHGAQTQFQYLDLGMNFAATLTEAAGGVVLKSKVEQLTVAEEKPGVGDGSDPIIRQTSLEGTSLLTLGKPLVLGSVDIPGSTRHVDVEAMVELVP